MYQRIFKQKGSRVYRGRYRLGTDPKIHDVGRNPMGSRRYMLILIVDLVQRG